MLKKTHGPALRRELKFIVECSICSGKGAWIGVFHEMDCERCMGSGWVCGHTLQPLSPSEIVPVLNARLRDALDEISKAGRRIGCAQEQYEQNNRRGAGGTNYTGD
ncbi:hypothetical protein [Pseudomonas ovata]|uniref:hypothetical protein n=1 Tax=Pseudomonas ovata TaxID=1839709 RepID=UPI001F4F0DD6|nr:hypothetical protein [Pseudomonas ovata]